MQQDPIPWSKVEAILFDLDGTLVETDNRWAAILAEKLRPLKRLLPRLDVERLARAIVMGIETPGNYAISVLEHLGLSTSFFGLADWVRRSKGLATREAAELVAGSEALLAALDGRLKLGVVTTRAKPEAEAFIRLAGLERFFAAVVTRQDVWRMKPHPEPIHKAAALLGVAPERCVVVGDTVMDIRAARRAGAYAVGVLSGFGERRELERAGAHLILESAMQLLEHLPRAQGPAESRPEI
jgi:beta-phosphoglucomutase-like phosphatase (HAD superfamily)